MRSPCRAAASPAQLLDGRGRHAAAGAVLGNPVAEFGGAVLELVGRLNRPRTEPSSLTSTWKAPVPASGWASNAPYRSANWSKNSSPRSETKAAK